MATRDERVRLILQDAGFTSGMAKATAAAAGLDAALNGLDDSNDAVGRTSRQTSDDVDGLGDSFQRSKGKAKEFTLEMAVAEERSRRFKKELRDQAKAAIDAEQGLDALGDEVDHVGTSTRQVGPDIDRFSGRLRLFADAAAILGPSLVPIGAVAVPAITGLASQLGFAAVGMGSLVVAAQGVGDAMEAVNEAALEPTADNLRAAQEAMEKLGPEAQQFVARFQELRPVLSDVRDAAAAGWFPGLTEALDDVERIAPNLERIFRSVGEAGGGLAADLGDWFAGPEGQEFLSFIEAEAPRALETLGRTVGNLADGMAELWMAFQPLNNDFAGWLLDISERFADWSAGLSETQGFEDFVSYIRENGPQVAETFSALGDAVVQVVEAIAPLGGPSLQIIEGFAEAVAAIADSDMGTPILAAVSALALYNRSLAITVGLQRQAAAAGFIPGSPERGGRGGGFLAGAGRVGGALALASGGVGVYQGTQADTDPFSQRDPDANFWNPMDFGKYALGGQFFQETGFRAKDFLGFGEGNGFGFGDLHPRRQGAQIPTLSGEFDPKTQTAAPWAKQDLGGAEVPVDDYQRLAEVQERAAGAGAGAARAQDQLLASLKRSGSQAGLTQAELGMYNETLIASRDASLGLFSATTSYHEALKSAREQAGNNNAGIKGMSDAALDNRRNLEQLAGSWNQLARTGEATDKQFRDSRRSFIQTAVAMGVPRRAAKQLADQLLDVPEKVQPKVDLQGADSALTQAARVAGSLRDLNGETARTFIITERIERYVRQGVAPAGNTKAAFLEKADGGRIPGARRPYRDSVHILGAPGEFVVSNRNGQVDRNEELLKAINANRYADGGTVGGTVGGSRRLPPPAQSQRLSVGFEPARATVTINTPWGTQNAEVQMRAVARQEIDADLAWRQEQGYA